MSDARATHWQPDPLLARTPARAPHFVRMPWDENQAQAFGPWRMQDKADPTAPQTEPAKSLTSARPTGSASDDASSAATACAEPATTAPPPTDPAADGQATAGAGPDAAAGMAATGSAPVAVQVGGASEQELTVARQQGYVLGIKDGLSKALNDLEAERQKEREALRSLMIELRALEQNPQRFFEPLRRLALHLAEQLVRGELSVSGQAIDRLVKSCLDDLGSHDKAVVVMLNPDDLRRLQALQIEAQSELRLDPDPALLPGSVRVRVHDAEIRDFIDNRLEALARRLLSDPEAWLQKSSLLHPHEAEPLPDSAPKRAWFAGQQDIQDAPTKTAAAPLDEAASAAPEVDTPEVPPHVSDGISDAISDSISDSISGDLAAEAQPKPDSEPSA